MLSPSTTSNGATKINSNAILFSGGWDSLYCYIKSKSRFESSDLLFFDYGQPYLESETLAVFNMQTEGLKTIKFIKYEDVVSVKDGIFDNRNGRLLQYVKTLGYTSVYIGTRNPFPMFDKYGDSNYFWSRQQSKLLNLNIYTPAILMPKFLIKFVCRLYKPELAKFVFSTEGLS